MNEAEWRTCADPQRLLQMLPSRTVRNDRLARKDRLAALACLRQVLTWEHTHAQTIEFLEQSADGTITREANQRVVANARRAIPTDTGRDEHGYDRYIVALMLYRVLVSRQAAHHALHAIAGLANGEDIQESSCDLIRDIFGNPFLTVPVNPSWLTSTVTALAHAIYDERAFDRMPILADALEDVGCTNQHILAHCRWPSLHVRGCWVVDLVLGRE